MRLIETNKVNGSGVCIFEATDRVGGRIYSLRGMGPNKDLSVDAGGGYQKKTTSIHPVKKFVRKT